MASTHRINRVREMLLREFNDIVLHLKDPRIGLVTVMDTEISKDLRYAKMFVSVIGSKEEQEEAVKALENALGFIRREIAQRVKLRYAPEIRIVYDETAERAASVIGLINSLNTGEDR